MSFAALSPASNAADLAPLRTWIGLDAYGAALAPALLFAALAVAAVLGSSPPRRGGRERGAQCVALLGGLCGGLVMLAANQVTTLVLGAALLELSGALLATADLEPGSGLGSRRFRGQALALALAAAGAVLLYGLSGRVDFAGMSGAGVSSGGADPGPARVALLLLLVGIGRPLITLALGPARGSGIGAPQSLAGSAFDLLAAAATVGALGRLLALLCLGDGVAETATLRLLAQRGAPWAGALCTLWMVLSALGALRASTLGALASRMGSHCLCWSGLALAAASETGLGAALVQVAVAAVSAGGLFAAAARLERREGTDALVLLRGAGWRSPGIAAAFCFLMLAAAGLPPSAGFASRLRVLLELGHSGQGEFALLALLASAACCLCGVRAAAFLFGAPGPNLGPETRTAGASLGAACGAALCTLAALAVLLGGVWTRPLEAWIGTALAVLRPGG